MDNNNNVPAQGETNMDGDDWRREIKPNFRQSVINSIMDHLSTKGIHSISAPPYANFKEMAERLEQKIYTTAESKDDYEKRIYANLSMIWTKPQNTDTNNFVPSNSAASNPNPQDLASQYTPSQVDKQGQSLVVPLANQSQACPQLFSESIQNTIASTGVQSSTGLASGLPSLTDLTQNSMPIVGSQNSNLQNISEISQNETNHSVGQGMISNIFGNSQRQMHGRQHLPQKHQQQSQNPQQHIYQQKQLFKQKLHHGNIQPTLIQSHIQQQQQNLLEPNQVKPSQESLVQSSSGFQSNQSTVQQTQPSEMQSPCSDHQQNQQSSVQQSMASMLQQHSQSILSQQQQLQQSVHQRTPFAYQQQATMSQQLMLPPQKQNLLTGQRSVSNLQHNQLLGHQSSVGDLQQQQQQQQQVLLSLPNNLPDILQQQQFLSWQNNNSNLHEQQLVSQSKFSGLQQKQLLGPQSGLSNMQQHQTSVHILQQAKAASAQQQQIQQMSATSLPSQGQQSQSQTPQQQLISQFQSQTTQLQQELGFQQQSNSLQRDMQQKFQTSSTLHHPQNVMEQQKQLFQSQRVLPEVSSTPIDSTAQTGHLNDSDWQEKMFQKAQSIKEIYLPDIKVLYQKITANLQKQDSLTQPPKSEQNSKLKTLKIMLDSFIHFLHLPKSNIGPSDKEKLDNFDRNIIGLLNSMRAKKHVSGNQQGQQQLRPPCAQSHTMQQQQQQLQSQIHLMPPHEKRMNTQMQPMNLQSSVTSIKPAAVTSMRHGSIPQSTSLGFPTAQPNMTSSLQNLESGQGNVHSSLQQRVIGSLQHNTMITTQQENINSASQGPLMLRPKIYSYQPNSYILQNQQLRQQQEQQVIQTQQLKQQCQQRQVHRQLFQQQKPQNLQQQLHQQKQQQPVGNHMSLHHINDADDMNMKQGMSVKSGTFQKPYMAGQHSVYHNQQRKPNASIPIASPQLLQATSPQISQHFSPQIDQQNLHSLSRSGTPLHSANSPFVVASPSTPLAPSPIPGDLEKQSPGVCLLSNTGNTGQPQTDITPSEGQSQLLSIATPGISPSPLLAEFTGPDIDQGTTSTISSEKSGATDQPLERLIKVVKSISSKALGASMGEIKSVVNIDRITGSEPSKESIHSINEDLVEMQKLHLQRRKFFSQDVIFQCLDTLVVEAFGCSNDDQPLSHVKKIDSVDQVMEDKRYATKKMKRQTSSMPLNDVSSSITDDDFEQLHSLEVCEFNSTATSRIKRPRIEANHALLKEIREINQQLISTVVEEDTIPIIGSDTDESGEGTIVKCSFSTVALKVDLIPDYPSSLMSPILPLRLLVPTNYPDSSPIPLDKLPGELSKEYEDLSAKAKSRFSLSLRNLSQPLSLREMAKTWDLCSRMVLAEYAHQNGGGTFSSKYSTWENCMGAA